MPYFLCEPLVMASFAFAFLVRRVSLLKFFEYPWGEPLIHDLIRVLRNALRWVYGATLPNPTLQSEHLAIKLVWESLRPCSERL
jgi:hypothetical protein